MKDSPQESVSNCPSSRGLPTLTNLFDNWADTSLHLRLLKELHAYSQRRNITEVNAGSRRGHVLGDSRLTQFDSIAN